jgi:hypothetical protein
VAPISEWTVTNFEGAVRAARDSLAELAWPRVTGQVPATALKYLASAAVMEQLAAWALAEAQKEAAKARAFGATWADVALATGYASDITAANHFEPDRRDRRAAEARDRRASWPNPNMAACKVPTSPRIVGVILNIVPHPWWG